jgi:hypothetical protein
MKRKDILAILIPSFIFVIAWIILSIHHNVVTSTISEKVNMQIASITPTFDTTIITSLKKRQSITPSYETTIPIQNIITPATPSAITPTVVTPSISSGSAKTATSEGKLSE